MIAPNEAGAGAFGRRRVLGDDQPLARNEVLHGNDNNLLSLDLALLATFMGKDDNIVQTMQQAQADKLDHWATSQRG